jgi:F-type H+-transporting ATPase subunit delta
MLNLKLVENYAKAIFNNAADLGVQQESLEQLKVLNQSIMKDQAVNEAFLSPIVAVNLKAQIFDKILKQFAFNQVVQRFFLILLQNSRAEILEQIIEKYEELLQQSQNIKVVHVTSSGDLSQKDQEFLMSYLKEGIHQKIELKLQQDKKIIGGVVIRYDSKVIDCSILGALSRIEKYIVKN